MVYIKIMCTFADAKSKRLIICTKHIDYGTDKE